MSIETLTQYGKELLAAGFEVWLTKTNYRDGGYLQYRDPATGAAGSLQYSDSLPGWQHLMPLVPSREYGSFMYLDTETFPFSVAAAQECAQLTNYNAVVGVQRNAQSSTWRSAEAVPLHV